MTEVLAFIHESLTAGQKLVWLYVVDSQGSSPGRRSFQMAVSEAGEFAGTIGGGIMEVKLITLAKRMLQQDSPTAIIKRQYHDKSRSQERSGMICSGDQTVVLMPLSEADTVTIETLLHTAERPLEYFIEFSSAGIKLTAEAIERIEILSEDDFKIILKWQADRTIHIFGAGHVGIALSKQLQVLRHQIQLYDNRPALEMPVGQKIDYAVVDYEMLKSASAFHPEDLVVIVSHSYRDDKKIIQQLYDLPLAYIGMMGSDAKISQLWEELAQEGISGTALEHVKAPIGIPILSKTAAEIAVSITAQMIYTINKELPTGRNQGL